MRPHRQIRGALPDARGAIPDTRAICRGATAAALAPIPPSVLGASICFLAAPAGNPLDFFSAPPPVLPDRCVRRSRDPKSDRQGNLICALPVPRSAGRRWTSALPDADPPDLRRQLFPDAVRRSEGGSCPAAEPPAIFEECSGAVLPVVRGRQRRTACS